MLNTTVSNLIGVARVAILLLAASHPAAALLMRDNGPEPIIVQIKDSARVADNLDAQLIQFAALRNREGLTIRKWWAGSKLMALVTFPGNLTEEQALAVVDRLEHLEGVEKVVAASASNLSFRSGDFLREFGPNDNIPEAARRGFDADRLRNPVPRTYDQSFLDQTPHVSNRLIVRWKDEFVWRASESGFTETMASLHANAGCNVVREIRPGLAKLIQVVECDNAGSLAAKLQHYMNSGFVVYAQPAFLYNLNAVPNDPWYSSSPGPQWSLPIIKAEQAWNIHTGDPSVVVAVGDTGANTAHPDITPHFVGGHNSFDLSTNVTDDDIYHPYHGTGTASLIGAKGNNQTHMTGVAWDVSMLIVKIARRTPGADPPVNETSSEIIADGIIWAAENGAVAMNLSLGLPDTHCQYINDPENPPPYWYCPEGVSDPLIYDAIDTARKLNMVTVCAAGNAAHTQWPDDGSFQLDTDLDKNTISPGSIPLDNNISVLATTRTDVKAYYSSQGKYRVDLGAPGGEDATPIGGILDPLVRLSPDPSTFLTLAGTSAAAPLVTGALALIKSKYPWEDYLGLRDRVLMGTEKLSSLSGICRTGGRLDLRKALQPRSIFLNLSTRAKVSRGDRIMIGGFSIKGAGSLQIVLRGLGPSLPGITVPKLYDPKITLNRSNGTQVDSNNDWQNLSSQDQSILINLGLAPSNNREAALVKTLSAGSYTVFVESQTELSQDLGVGLFEVYAIGDEQTRLVNLSTRCLVGTGQEEVIAGTIIGNVNTNTPLPKPERRVLAFGKGPSLSPFVGGYLANPHVELLGANGVSNDDWKKFDDDSGSNHALEDKLGAALLAPASLLESAIWPTFAPGAYTVKLTGENQTSGIGLIEFYEY